METTPHEAKHPRELVHVPVSVSERKGLLDKSAAAGIPAMPLLGKLPLHGSSRRTSTRCWTTRER